MKWYQATAYYNFEIKEVEVHKETKHTLTIGHGRLRRVHKISRTECYFKDRAEAVEWVRERLTRSLQSAEQSLESRREHLAKFEAMEGGTS